MLQRQISSMPQEEINQKKVQAQKMLRELEQTSTPVNLAAGLILSARFDMHLNFMNPYLQLPYI
jgi:hypothetical protein